MSDAEQDTIAKNLLWEYIAVRRKEVCLKRKSDRFASSLKEVATAVDRGKSIDGLGVALPEEAEIHAVRKELDATRCAIESRKADLGKL